MKRRILSLLLATVLFLSLTAPTASADARYFSDVALDAWYADAVMWAANNGVARGYADGTFGVGKTCTTQEAITMLWRAAGSVDVGEGAKDDEKAMAWLERQTGTTLVFIQAKNVVTRANFCAILYYVLGDLATPKAKLAFTDLNDLGEDQADYIQAISWAVVKGLVKGVSETEFAPKQPMTREQVVTILCRAFRGELPYTVTQKTVPLYVSSVAAKDSLPLYFMDGQEDIPYLSVEYVHAFLRDICAVFATAKGYRASSLEFSADGERVTILRDGLYPMYLDFDTDTISFLDYDAFIRDNPDGSVMNIISLNGKDAQGQPMYIQFQDSGSERYGKAMRFDLGAYGLRLIHAGDGYYLPLQTFNDLLLSIRFNSSILYNGEAAFFSPGEELLKMYYSAPTGARSPALALFTYKELCFALDHFYGLKKQHNIRSFHEESEMNGLMGDLLSTDPAKASAALWRLTCYHLDDSHTGFLAPSYLEGPEVKWEKKAGESMTSMHETSERLAQARKAAFPNGVPGYQEVGDTAYITFDSFTQPAADYYVTPPDASTTDTVGLMIYAYSQITRADSPVKNVVMDLSCNGGGAADSAAYVIGTFLGRSSISLRNTLTDALVTQNCLVDLNLDRKFDEKDSLLNYNLFCLASPFSFSCGNLVPCAFKSSHRVTLLGQTSGGGSCSVLKMTTADGAQFQMSSPYCLSFLKNGSFYDIDQGATPDHVINDYAKFYDRAALTEYIHNLY